MRNLQHNNGIPSKTLQILRSFYSIFRFLFYSTYYDYYYYLFIGGWLLDANGEAFLFKSNNFYYLFSLLALNGLVLLANFN